MKAFYGNEKFCIFVNLKNVTTRLSILHLNVSKSVGLFETEIKFHRKWLCIYATEISNFGFCFDIIQVTFQCHQQQSTFLFLLKFVYVQFVMLLYTIYNTSSVFTLFSFTRYSINNFSITHHARVSKVKYKCSSKMLRLIIAQEIGRAHV